MGGNNYNGERIHWNSVSSGVVRDFKSCNFYGVDYCPKGGPGNFKETALKCRIELKYEIRKFQLDDNLGFTPRYY